jgi:hypothetical protein
MRIRAMTGGGSPSVANGIVYFPVGDIYTVTGTLYAFSSK